MSKTISFVASDDLAEFLEDEAERRFTTVSSTAQMLLAEKVRGMERFQEEPTEESEVLDRLTEGVSAEEVDEYLEQVGTSQDPLDRHQDAWYRPDSEEHDYAVRIPADVEVYDAGETRYYKTRNGAAEAIRKWYE